MPFIGIDDKAEITGEILDNGNREWDIARHTAAITRLVGASMYG